MKYIQQYQSIIFRIILAMVLLGVFLGVLALYQKFFTLAVRTRGGSYHEGIVGTARFINPVLAQSSADKDLTEIVFGSLIDVDNNGNIDFRIAQSLEVSDDQKTYQLRLHPDARFSDGTPITASDVVFTIEKIKSPLIKSPLFSRWIGVDAIASGNHEVTFTLSQPYADFIYNLTIGVLPRHVWEETTDEEFAFSNYNTKPISSGWYRVSDVSYESDGSPRDFQLKPNIFTFDRAYLSSINISTYDNVGELKDAYLRNEVDGAYGISPALLDKVNPKAIHSGTLPRTFGIFFNTQNNKEVLGANVRHAINQAINRDQIINEVFGGYAAATHSPLGTASKDTYDSQAAATTLEKDGWNMNAEGVLVKSINGTETPLSFTMVIPNIKELVQVGELVSRDLALVGIIANIRNYDEATLTNEVLRNRDYDAILFGYVMEKPSDAFAFWHSSQMNDPGLNISVYNNPRVDATLTNIRNQQNRNDDIQMFQELLMRDTPAVFLYTPEYLYLVREQFEIPRHITNASERFNEVNQWYLRTNHVWKFLIRETIEDSNKNEYFDETTIAEPMEVLGQ